MRQGSRHLWVRTEAQARCSVRAISILYERGIACAEIGLPCGFTCHIQIRALLRQDIHSQLPNDNISACLACTVPCRTDLVALVWARCPMNVEKQRKYTSDLLSKRHYGALNLIALTIRSIKILRA